MLSVFSFNSSSFRDKPSFNSAFISISIRGYYLLLIKKGDILIIDDFKLFYINSAINS
jgi:hypothetical protein